MKRDLEALVASQFDLLVVGGGIHGAFAAWDAALRGLSVALIERGDFGGATSSNSLKIAHGGLRHLQRGDIKAVSESLDEQITLRRIAPHLVRPLACAMELRNTSPAQSSAAVGAALAAYAAVTRLRARRLGADKFPASGRLLGKTELTQLLPPFGSEWRRGALWFDAIVESPERLLIGVVRAAVDAGAVVASYVEARTFSADHDGVTVGAVDAVDAENTNPLEIRTRLVLNAAGPWAPELAARWGGSVTGSLARACNVVVRAPERATAMTTAVALRHPSEPRMLFTVPWRGRMMIGTSYTPATLTEGARPGSRQVDQLLSDFNASAPEIQLSRDDILLVHGGLLPALPGITGADGVAVPLQPRPQLIDHKQRDGLDGIISMTGVKWTTARRVAERAVDLCQQRLQAPVKRGGTDRRSIVGAPARSESTGNATGHTFGLPGNFRRDVYGEVAAEVDAIAVSCPELATPVAPGSAAIGAQIVHAIRNEAAMHLDDIVLRRTELGTAGIPSEPELAAVAHIAAREFGWSATRTGDELARLRNAYTWGKDDR